MRFTRYKEQSTVSYRNQGFNGRPPYPTAVQKGEGLNCSSQLLHTSVLKINISVFQRRAWFTDCCLELDKNYHY